MKAHDYVRIVGPESARVEVHVSPSGAVVWSSDWSRMDTLTREGYLRRVNYGPDTFGHVDYFVSD